jgi:hypothetical protein
MLGIFTRSPKRSPVSLLHLWTKAGGIGSV